MNQDTGDGLLIIEYEDALLDALEKALDKVKDQRFVILKNACNATAKQAKADLIAKAQAEYTAKKGRLNKATTTKKATTSKPEATITVKGTTMELMDFKATAPRSGANAKILASSSLKAIQSMKGSRAKAFLATFESGHSAIVQRQDGEEYARDKAKRQEKYGPGIDVTRLKKLLTISFPKMVGGREVLGELAPSIYENLLDNISKEIQRVMK